MKNTHLIEVAHASTDTCSIVLSAFYGDMLGSKTFVNVLLWCAINVGIIIVAERVSVRQLLRIVFSRYACVRTYVSVTLKNVN